MNKAIVVLTTVAAVVGTEAFAAAGSAPAAAYSWTGLYLSLDAGLALDRQTVSDFACSSCNTLPASATLNGGSLTGGVYAGFNFAIAPTWLVGIEADWSSMHFNDATTAPQMAASGGIGAPPAINGWSHDTKWLASLRGRVGVTPLTDDLVIRNGRCSVDQDRLLGSGCLRAIRLR